MRLYDIARVIRSKNAGPFTLTIDLIFKHENDFIRVVNSPLFNTKNIAETYRVDPEKVEIHQFRKVLAVKITMPRRISSGAPGDQDVYGSQQHFPLALMNL